MKVINRIKANEDFALAIKNGRSLKSNSFTIHLYKNQFDRIRIGISVSKKIGNAVTRNRVKRQIRAMCDSIFDYKSESLDIVIIAKNGFLEKNFWENKEMLFNLLNSVNILGAIK
ncbi:MAG: ribonuclease P protein component [Bacilli bacterium]|nr:ribonuclease P protein component [Bacilli bacterium]